MNNGYPLIEAMGLKVHFRQELKLFSTNPPKTETEYFVRADELEQALEKAPKGEAIKADERAWMFDTRGQIKHDRPVFEARLLINRDILWQPDTAEKLIADISAGLVGYDDKHLQEFVDRARQLLAKGGE